MKLYKWDSEVLADDDAGKIAVVASSPEDARTKVIAAFDKQASSSPDKHGVLHVLNFFIRVKGINLDKRIADFRTRLLADIAGEPEIIDSGVIFIDGYHSGVY